MERQSKVLEEVGGEKGIQELTKTAAGAGDVAAAVAEAEASAEAAGEEADAAKKVAEEARKEAAAAKEQAAAAEEAAVRLAADKVCVCMCVYACVFLVDIGPAKRLVDQ